MPPDPHQPRSDAHDHATSTATCRARVADVNPDDVLRNIRRCNGFRSWLLAPREIYRLADSTLTVYEHHERAPELILDGPDAEQIRSLLTRLGFEPHDIVINALQPARDLQ